MPIQILDPRNYRKNMDLQFKGGDLDLATIVVGESHEDALQNGYDFFLIPLCDDKHRIATKTGAIKNLSIAQTGDAVEQCVVCAKISKDRRKVSAGDQSKANARRLIEARAEAKELGLELSEIL